MRTSLRSCYDTTHEWLKCDRSQSRQLSRRTVFCVVRASDRFRLVFEGVDEDDRAEDFLRGDARGIRYLGAAIGDN